MKSYLWGGIGCPNYKSEYDLPAGSMYERAKVKGKIDTLPELPGVIVISRKNGNHVGIYIGGDQTIESTLGSRGDGVVKQKLDRSFWTDWFECSFIEYKHEELRAVTLAYKAAVRSEPKTTSRKLGELAAGTKCMIVSGPDAVDPKTKYVYVKLAGEQERWIVKSAIK